MKKSKIILCFSFIILFFYINYSINNISSKYSLEDDSINGIVTSIKYYDNKISYVVKAKENVLVNDYNFISDIKLGDEVILNGVFVLPKNNSNFYLFNYKEYLLI